MNRMPTRNLPPQAEPWGRAVDSELAGIARTNQKQAQDTGNALSAVNGTLTRLGEQVSEIRTIADTLVVQQATLEAQQTVLESQQAQLTDTVGELQEAVAGMIRTANTQSLVTGFTITSASTVIDTVSFVVPAGYTRANVIAMAAVTAANSSAASDYLYVKLNIQGVSSGEGFNGFPSNQWSDASVQSVRSLNVTPGGSLSVDTAVRVLAGPYVNGNHTARLVVQVLFLR